MEITFHTSWKRSSRRYYCDSSTLVNSNTAIDRRSYSCQYGCQGSVRVSLLCIEYSAENDWSYLEGHETHVFTVSDINAVTIGTTGGAWVNPYGNWNISTTFSLAPRADTGQINSSPRVVSFPKLQLLEGHHHNISLAVIDPDDDRIQCRWASGTECSSVCNSIPGAVLDPNSCTIRYHANFGIGVKAIAIMIEDFVPCSFIPLSSVAHQFLVEVVSISQLICPSLPWFITPLQGKCINIPPSSRYTQQLIATSGCSNVSITSIQIIAPIGASKGELHHVQGTNNYYINITWMPTANQQNDTHFLCYIAVSSENLTSEQSCIQLAAGYHPPAPKSATPNHQFVYPSNNSLQIMFDKKIQRPSTAAFIRFYKSGEVVYQIDTSSSVEVNFNGANLTIVPNYVFIEGSTYNVYFDEGVVESVEECHLGNDPILSETFWTFEILNLVPGKILVCIDTYNT